MAPRTRSAEFSVILKNFLEITDYVASCKLFQGPNQGYIISTVSTNVTLVGIFGSKRNTYMTYMTRTGVFT